MISPADCAINIHGTFNNRQIQSNEIVEIERICTEIIQGRFSLEIYQNMKDDQKIEYDLILKKVIWFIQDESFYFTVLKELENCLK